MRDKSGGRSRFRYDTAKTNTVWIPVWVCVWVSMGMETTRRRESGKVDKVENGGTT